MNLPGIVLPTLFYNCWIGHTTLNLTVQSCLILINMISLVIIILTVAFYIFYNTSEKSVKNRVLGFEKWVQKKKRWARITGLAMFTIAYLILSLYSGFGAGSLLFFIILMTFGSLIIVLTPLKMINYKNLLIVVLFSLCIEFLIL